MVPIMQNNVRWERGHNFQWGSIPNNGVVGSPQPCDSCINFMKFDCEKKGLLVQMMLTVSMRLLTLNHMWWS